MIISGLVIQYNPALTDSVVAQLRAAPGVSEITLLERGRVVCVLEAVSPEASASVVNQLVQVEGIYTVMPTYIYDLEEEDRWSSPAVLS
ncbi:MAG: chaperone NapD [Bacillota bacterium]